MLQQLWQPQLVHKLLTTGAILLANWFGKTVSANAGAIAAGLQRLQPLVATVRLCRQHLPLLRPPHLLLLLLLLLLPPLLLRQLRLPPLHRLLRLLQPPKSPTLLTRSLTSTNRC